MINCIIEKLEVDRHGRTALCSIPLEVYYFKKIYRNLESRVMFELRETIDKSGYISKHTNTKAIKVDVEFYEELTSINDKLFFIDKKGLHYDYFNVGLDCLIDFLDERSLV